MTGLERFALLADLDEADRGELARRLEQHQVEAGRRLFREGDPADALLLLLEGRVRLCSERHRTRGEVGPGSALGALSLVVDGPREASAETLSASRVLRLTRRGFRDLRAKAPETACKLLEALVRESAAFARDALTQLSVG